MLPRSAALRPPHSSRRALLPRFPSPRWPSDRPPWVDPPVGGGARVCSGRTVVPFTPPARFLRPLQKSSDRIGITQSDIRITQEAAKIFNVPRVIRCRQSANRPPTGISAHSACGNTRALTTHYSLLYASVSAVWICIITTVQTVRHRL
eukprot:1196059-Prorocentrum_minimum.AAC.1